MFGEPIPRAFLDACFEQAGMADAIIVAGTSANVVPAADFAVMVLRRGGAMIEVNTDPTPFTDHCAAVLRGPSGELLPKLVDAVKKQARHEESHRWDTIEFKLD